MKPTSKTKTALDLTIDLAHLFHHKDYRWIEADNQLQPNWATKTDHPLSAGELVVAYLDEQKLIGVGFGQLTKYVMLDIDYLSKYHPTHDTDEYQRILHTLESIGLTRYVVLQSSYSGGLHIYLPVRNPVKTFSLAAAIRVVLTNAGIDLQNGQLEIFPHTKQFASKPGEYSHYKPHRLPLQPNSGSRVMSDDGLSPQPILNTIEAQLAAFIEQWEMATQGQDMELLNRKLPQLYETFKKRKRKYQTGTDSDKSKKAREWEAALELDTAAIAWTDNGQTYNLLPKFLAKGVVFLKLKGEELYEWMHTAITNAPGYRQYCRHQHEIGLIIRSWIKTNDRTGYYSPYRSEPDRNQRYPFGDPARVKKPKRQPNTANKKAAELALHRLKTAYGCLIDRLTPNLKIDDLREMIRAQMKKIFKTACSNSILNKHKNIWHPAHNGKNLTTLTQPAATAPENRPDLEISPSIDSSTSELFEAQTETQRESDHPKSSMICSAPDLLPNINIPPHPRELNFKSTSVVQHNQEVSQPTKGKFEVLAEALSKMTALATLVVGIVTAAGVMTGAEAVLMVPPVERLSPIPTAENTTTQTDILDLPPSQDPRIPLMHLFPYNPNQNGVPWKSKQERDKFAGYLVIIAKGDKSIGNPHAWAVKSLKNLTECGINSHWLAFTGQEMLDPDSPQAQLLRQYFPSVAPPPANVIIRRRAEPTSGVIGRITNQLNDQSNEQPNQTNLLPIDDPNIKPYYALNYRDNCRPGVPWRDAQEFNKFLGYMLLVAQSDKFILDSYRWVIKTTKNLIEIERHWLNFSGQKMAPISFNIQTPETQSRRPTSSMESIRDIAARVNNSTPSDSETGHQHTSGKEESCPECQILTPALELERWKMCCFCAQKILFKRTI